MIAPSLTQIIQKQLCTEIQVSSQDGRIAISFPLIFGDGDACELFVEEDENGSLCLTDDGIVHAVAASQGVDLTLPGYSKRLQKMAAFYGAREHLSEIKIDVTQDRIGDAAFSLAQACLDLSRLAYLPPEKESPPKKSVGFGTGLTKLIQSSLGKLPFESDWHHPTLDAKSRYHVDYCVHTAEREHLLFGIGTEAKWWKSLASIQHYQIGNLNMETVVVYSKEVGKKHPTFMELMIENASRSFSFDTEKPMLKRYLKSLPAIRRPSVQTGETQPEIKNDIKK